MWEASPANWAGSTWSAVEVVPSKKPSKSFGGTGSFWASFCDPFAGVAALSIISLLVTAHSSPEMKIWHLGISTPSSRVGNLRALDFYPSDQCIEAEGDLPWRKSSMTLLNNPYNLPHNKIIEEELGVHKGFPVGLNPGKFFGLTHPNRHFTTERSKTESCGWKRKRKFLMQTPGKDQLTSVVMLFFPNLKTPLFPFFQIVIFIKNIFLIIQ